MKLRIATWNLERPATSSLRNSKILEKLSEVDADIFVLTETNSAINPGGDYKEVSTTPLSKADGAYYRQGEIRTTVWSKSNPTHHTVTYDAKTAVCTLIPTSFGELNIYGTIIGVFGNRHPTFLSNLEAQIADWKKISASKPICVVGDFNLSFKDAYYYTKTGRQLINDCFKRLDIKNLTCDIENNIDHIAITESFAKHATVTKGFWNENKRLSDHKGVWIALES